jgi:hypothetical protein
MIRLQGPPLAQYHHCGWKGPIGGGDPATMPPSGEPDGGRVWGRAAAIRSRRGTAAAPPGNERAGRDRTIVPHGGTGGIIRSVTEKSGAPGLRALYYQLFSRGAFGAILSRNPAADGDKEISERGQFSFCQKGHSIWTL